MDCAGGAPGPVAGWEGFRYVEARTSDGRAHALNWAWRGDRVVRVSLDRASFADAGAWADDAATSAPSAPDDTSAPDDAPPTPVSAVGVLASLVAIEETFAAALATWSDAGDVTLVDAGDGPADARVTFAAEADAYAVPAYTTHAAGDAPETAEREVACLLAAEVTFFPTGTAADGTPVTYAWVLDGADVADVDPADGRLEKPVHDTLVHELGHVLGLGDQDDPAVDCSVMAHCADLSCGCTFDTLGPIDQAALGTVYADAQPPRPGNLDM